MTSVTCEQLCEAAAIILHLASVFCLYCAAAAAASAVVGLFSNAQTQRHYVCVWGRKAEHFYLYFMKKESLCVPQVL